MKKILFIGLLLSIALTISAQRQMQVWQDGVPTSFAVAEVDSITFNKAYNTPLIGKWYEPTFLYNVSISDSLIQIHQIQGQNQDHKYKASKNLLHIERLWLDPSHPYDFVECNYIIKGDTLHIDDFEWTLVGPSDVTLIRLKQ